MSMNRTARINALVAYLLPVVGWAYLLLFQRKNTFAMFHLKQAIGIFVFFIAVALGWGVVTWVITWIPYGFVLGVGLFALVIVAVFASLVFWLMGLANALNGRSAFIPIVGKRLNQLPF